ncbi:MAG: glycosyltransferase family 39 protein, partial [FCB group bacterium]|nr:glycosyltransferase family 39 protein [FCB group bacterium]
MPSTGPQDHPAPPASQPVEPRTRAEWPVLLLLIALAFAIRLFRLGTVNLRSDEVLELLKAEHLYNVLFQGMLLDTHAPFFPLVTKLWSLLGLTANDWLVRLLPATLGVASIPLIYALTRSLYGRRPAWIAALLLAVSPFYVTLSRDMKDDIFLVFIGML